MLITHGHEKFFLGLGGGQFGSNGGQNGGSFPGQNGQGGNGVNGQNWKPSP